MRIVILVTIVLLGVKGMNWLGTWNVTQGCILKDCCCPKTGTQLSIDENTKKCVGNNCHRGLVEFCRPY